MATSISNTERSLMATARWWAGEITKRAKHYAPNAHLRSSIRSRVETKKEQYQIITEATGPDARAREYGSGVHARRSKTSKHQLGPRGKILIRPKNKKLLAFEWELANPEIGRFLPDGRVLFEKVEHPGVEAANGGKGYIAPAFNEMRKFGREKLSKEVRKAILGDLRASFKRGMKK